MYDILAMIKQLGPPTWWLTLSCADLRWKEIYKILSKLNGKELTDQEIDQMSYKERCEMLNSNPVVVAKHFQYRIERLFRDILLTENNPIGKTLYHAIRIEFQFRGSPHAHCFIWVKYCPSLTEDNLDIFVNYIDKYISAYLPDPVDSPELYEQVKTYQTHNHSKTCRKYKNLECRFNFGHFFTDKTVISKPLAAEIKELERSRILKQRNTVLSKVKYFINEALNPGKKQNHTPNLTIDEILSSLDIQKDEYYKMLSVSGTDEYEIHLKRPPNSCFINNLQSYNSTSMAG